MPFPSVDVTPTPTPSNSRSPLSVAELRKQVEVLNGHWKKIFPNGNVVDPNSISDPEKLQRMVNALKSALEPKLKAEGIRKLRIELQGVVPQPSPLAKAAAVKAATAKASAVSNPSYSGPLTIEQPRLDFTPSGGTASPATVQVPRLDSHHLNSNAGETIPIGRIDAETIGMPRISQEELLALEVRAARPQRNSPIDTKLVMALSGTAAVGSLALDIGVVYYEVYRETFAATRGTSEEKDKVASEVAMQSIKKYAVQILPSAAIAFAAPALAGEVATYAAAKIIGKGASFTLMGVGEGALTLTPRAIGWLAAAVITIGIGAGGAVGIERQPISRQDKNDQHVASVVGMGVGVLTLGLGGSYAQNAVADLGSGPIARAKFATKLAMGIPVYIDNAMKSLAYIKELIANDRNGTLGGDVYRQHDDLEQVVAKFEIQRKREEESGELYAQARAVGLATLIEEHRKIKMKYT